MAAAGAIEALRGLIDPVFAKPMVEIGTLEDIRQDAETVHMRVRLASPSEAMRKRTEENITQALAAAGLGRPDIEWNLQVPSREVLSDDPLPQVRNVILVMSGKGGVGKSTCATNLALAFAKTGARVGLLDADMYGPSIPTMLGISGHPSSDDGKKIKPLERFGVKLMSIGFLLEDPKAAVIWRGPMLHGALQQFLTDVEWGELDYLVLDLPPGTGDVALSIAQKLRVTGAVMVTTPQEVALQDVYKGVSMCEKLKIPVIGVIENMSFFIDSAGMRHELFGRGGGALIAEFAKAPLLGTIPIDATVSEWGDKGTPVVKAAPSSPAAQAFTDIAERLAARVAVAHFERRGGVKAPLDAGPKRLKVVP